MGTKVCPQCGTPNAAGGRFCGGCGLSLSVPASAHLPTPTGGGAPTIPHGAGQAGVPPQNVIAQAVTGAIDNIPLAAGVTLQSGRYMVDRALGAGGMGSVYLASDTHVNNKPVVIKEMANVYNTPLERQEAEEEFRAEMATLASLSHPNIPQIYDFFTESNRHFAVQEYVGGQDLQKAIEAVQVPNSPPNGLPENRVLSWASQVLTVLDYLESQNPQIIHRDIKPANIIVDAANRVRVVDFGIASHKFRQGSTGALAPQLSTALGTPGYAPKEQFSGLETPNSDLYALGATMHHLLTGRDPTKVQPLWEYPRVRTFNRKISEATEAIVERATQMDESKRFHSAIEMKREVDRILQPSGLLSTTRGRAGALAMLVLLVALAAGGSRLLTASQSQTPAHGNGPISDGGNVAFDLGTTGLRALGVSDTAAASWVHHKTNAALWMSQGKTNFALDEYRAAVQENSTDAESLIYLEDNRILDLDPHPYKIALAGSFSPALGGGANDVGVGRQNLQGAYAAQKAINDAGGVNGHFVYLVLATDGSSKAGAATAAQELGRRPDILGVVGFAFSSRTRASLPFLANANIPQISPTASNPTLNGSPYFFRSCPSDTEQGRVGLHYLLSTLLHHKSQPLIAVVGDPNDSYAGGLQTIVTNGAANKATVLQENYTIGQSDFSSVAADIQAHRVDGIYFAGYAREALLLSGALDAAGVPASVPIMSDDAFYEPANFVANPTPKGRFHFTSYFFPDEYRLLPGHAGETLQQMEQKYTGYFLRAGAPTGGYGTSRVSSDTALTYDAVRTILYAIGHVPGGSVSRQAVQQQLTELGARTVPYQGVSGRIAYATSGESRANGDPGNKALVILHLDAKRGRTHMDGFLGTY